MTRKLNKIKYKYIDPVPPKSKKGRRVVVAADDMAAAVADLLSDKGEGDLTLATRYGTTLRNIRELRRAAEAIRDELVWLREHEAEILDILRANILMDFIEDPNRKWSTVDYGVMLDKSRLLRSQVQSLEGLFAVIHEADRFAIEQLSGKKD